MIRLICLSFIACAVLGDSLPAQPLRWKLSKDQQFSVNITQSTNTSVATNGPAINSEYLMEMKLDWKVQSASSDSFVIEQTIARLFILGKRRDEETINLDTDKDYTRLKGAEKDLHQAIAALVGQTFVVEMTARGKVTRVSVPEEMMKELRKAPASMRIRQIFTDEGYQEIFGRATLEFPEQEVNAEHSWTETDEINFASGKVDVNHSYTINKNMSAENAQIDVKSRLSMQPSNEKHALKISIEKQTATGVIQFDRKNGLITSADMNTQLETRATYNGEKITSTIDSTIKLTIKAK